jgi:hypothetical protein
MMAQANSRIGARTTRLQALQAQFAALLEASHSTQSPREHAVLVDLLGRQLEAERTRIELALRRWAA